MKNFWLLLFWLVLLSLYGCWWTDCFDENWNTNKNPQIVNWEAVNCYNKDWAKEWKRVILHENWQVRIEENYHLWERDWFQHQYYEDWKPFTQAFFVNGKEEWTITTYHSNGQVMAEQYFEAWVQTGKQTVYYDNWQIKEETSYENGVRNWEYTSYSETWTITAKAIYKNWVLSN